MKKIALTFIMFLAVAGMKAQSGLDYLLLYPTKGWEANIEGGANLSLDSHKEWGEEHEKSAVALAGLGYNFNQNIYAGLETGVILSVGSGTINSQNVTTNLVPVLADFRYSFTTHHNWQPFAELRAGYGFRTNNKEYYNNYVVFNPRAGVRVRVTNGLDFHLAVGYMGLWSKDCPVSPTMKNLDGLSIQVGIGLHY